MSMGRQATGASTNTKRMDEDFKRGSALSARNWVIVVTRLGKR